MQNSADRSDTNKQNFISIFESKQRCQDQKQSSLWEPVDPQDQVFDPKFLIHNGKLQRKVEKGLNPQTFHAELYYERLLKFDMEQQTYECINITCCCLKKLLVEKQYKEGFRLYRENQLVELFPENKDQFNKWFDFLRRYTIIPNFEKKNRILTKIKTIEKYYTNSEYFKCHKYVNAMYYQVRVIDKQSLSQEEKSTLLKEIKFLRRFRLNSIQNLLEVYEDRNNLHLVFDNFIGKDLRFRLNDYFKLNEKNLAEIFYKLLEALNHIHRKKIIHRNLNLESIMIKSEHNLVDLCIIKFYHAEEIGVPIEKKVGTIGYMAPELFQGNQLTNPALDVFSLGVVFFMLAYNRSPFNTSNQQELMMKNKDSNIDWGDPKVLQEKLSESGIDLLKQMLETQPCKRITIQKALNHHWFIKKNIKEIQKSPNQLGCSLATIMEKSENEVSISCLDARYRLQQLITSYESINHLSELDQDSLNERVQNLNQIQQKLIPSKIRHDQDA